MYKFSEKYSKELEYAISIVVSAILSFFFLIRSPLHPWKNAGVYKDSSVFKTVALMMEKGYMPYRDSFDHKGPLLYIINYLGNRISPYKGIWIIEFVFLVTTIFIMYRIARLLCGKAVSVLAVLLSLSLLFPYFEGGNLTEEYAMPCIALALFVFLDYLKNDCLTNFRIVLSGVCLGVVLMIRPNMIAVWIVFCMLFFAKLSSKRKIEALVQMIILFVAGIAIVVVPIIIWLAINNDLYWFWHAYIEFNRIYSTVKGGRAHFQAQLSSAFAFFKTPVFIASIIILIFRIIKKNNPVINASYLIYMVLSVALATISGFDYPHYGMILVPSFVYPFSLMFECIMTTEPCKIRKPILIIITILSMAFLIMPDWLKLICTIPSTYETKDESAFETDETMKNLLDCISINTSADQAISVYGSYDLVYVLSNRKHATRYSYQFPIGEVMPEIMDEYFEQLQVEQPTLIVVTDDRLDDRMKSFLDLNNYYMVWCADSENAQSMAVYKKSLLS